MRLLEYHIQALKITVSTFVKGRFLWFFIPGLIISVAYYIIQFLAYNEYQNVQLSSEWSLLDSVFGWINYATSLAYSFFSFLLEKIYVFFVITILSPFHAFLAERFDRSMTGTKFPYSIGHFVRDILRMFAIVTLALVMQLGFVILWWALSFIPGLALLDDVMYFLISAFFYGFAFYDYAMERYRLSIGKSIRFAYSRPLMMICTGVIFLGVYSIPYVGIPISSVFATMISTVVYLRIHKKIHPKRNAINPKREKQSA